VVAVILANEKVPGKKVRIHFGARSSERGRPPSCSSGKCRAPSSQVDCRGHSAKGRILAPKKTKTLVIPSCLARAFRASISRMFA